MRLLIFLLLLSSTCYGQTCQWYRLDIGFNDPTIQLAPFILCKDTTPLNMAEVRNAIAQATRNANRDSAYKYWNISRVYMDSAIDAHDKRNLLLFKYYARKQREASSKSYKYAEKQ